MDLTARGSEYRHDAPRLKSTSGGFQVTDSMPIPAEASVRSTSSLMVRTLLSLGAATARNCSMAYCFSVSHSHGETTYQHFAQMIFLRDTGRIGTGANQRLYLGNRQSGLLMRLGEPVASRF